MKTFKDEYPYSLEKYFKPAILTAMGAGDFAMARRLTEIVNSYKKAQYAWINFETKEVRIARIPGPEEVLK